jgi:transglutaminase-like putative cysteine protease
MSSRRDHLVPAGEVALALVTLAAIVGMHRLFDDGSYFGPLAQQAILAHVAVTALRRAGVRLVPAALTTAALAVLVITWTRFPGTSWWLLPTGDTIGQLGDDLGAAWRLFGDVRAPAPVANGFIAASAAAVWLLVFLADWAAFRVVATFEALLPATTLFVFAAALGGPGSTVAGASLFSGAALLFVLLHRTANQETSSRWAGGQRTQGRWSLVMTGAGLTAATVVAAAIAGPRLPGADAEPVVAWRDLTKEDPTRVVLSPMVSLQTKLVDQPDVEVFTVRSERSSYWRLTSLDEFDGEIWRSSYSTADADGDLPRAVDSAVASDTVTQEVTIEALSSVWLPAAYEPVAIDTGDQATDFDARSSTLMVDREVASSDGYRYTVTSQIPAWSADVLRTASPEVPEDIADTYRQLPEGFSQHARTEATRLTQDEATAFDKALAIQDHLRTFTYDQNIGAGHSEDALLDFLFRTRKGYCEQFAAAFAALARAADLPARVAVGFTPGVQDPNDPTLFRVRGTHAHAWPEVYLGEYGWVPFEPTPTRGPPRADGWLGIPESQDTSSGGAAVTDPGPEGGELGQGGGDGISSDAAGDLGLTLGDEGLGAPADGGRRDRSIVPQPVRDASRPVGVGALAYLVVVPLAVVGQRLIRRRRASTAGAKVRLGWRTVTESAARAGIGLAPSMTVAETADRMAAALPASAPGIQQLARSVEMLAYAEVPPDDDEAGRLSRKWAAIVGEANRLRPWHQRVLTYLDVRQLVGGRRSRLVAHGGPAPAPGG